MKIKTMYDLVCKEEINESIGELESTVQLEERTGLNAKRDSYISLGFLYLARYSKEESLEDLRKSEQNYKKSREAEKLELYNSESFEALNVLKEFLEEIKQGA